MTTVGEYQTLLGEVDTPTTANVAATSTATTSVPALGSTITRVDDIDGEGGNIIDNETNNMMRITRTKRQRSILHLLFLSPFNDTKGNITSILYGFIGIFIIGTIIGIITPLNDTLTNIYYYRYISNCIGYIYFLCWSISFYPQVIQNYIRRSTSGLSIDFCLLNVIGFLFYSIYNISFYSNTYIQDLYESKYHSKITVQSNDVAFAVHAFILASITLCQIIMCDNGLRNQNPSKIIVAVIIVLVSIALLFPIIIILTATHDKSSSTDMMESEISFHNYHYIWYFDWLNYLYVLSYMKICISLIKYIPQVILNYNRKSTIGWSIWQILLDCMGGILSILQLVLDCMNYNDYTGITGNIAKFSLGFVSIIFDIIFMIQHYILYPQQHNNNNTNEDNNNNNHDNNTEDIERSSRRQQQQQNNNSLIHEEPSSRPLLSDDTLNTTS